MDEIMLFKKLETWTNLISCCIVKKNRNMQNVVPFNPVGNFKMKISETSTATFIQKPFMAGMNALLQRRPKLREVRPLQRSRRNLDNPWKF